MLWLDYFSIDSLIRGTINLETSDRPKFLYTKLEGQNCGD